MNNRRCLKACALAACCLALGLAGCKSQTTSKHSLRLNPSPEIDTLYESSDEARNATTVTFDTNFRAVWMDLGRMWLVDRPSRLAPYPIPR
jgi:hypothetical protein